MVRPSCGLSLDARVSARVIFSPSCPVCSAVPRLFASFLLAALASVRAGAGEAVPVSRPGVLHLNLDSAISMALAKNYTIQVSQFAPQIAQQEITRAKGFFDPEIQIGANRDYRSTSSVLSNGVRSELSDLSRTDVPLDASLAGNTVLGSQYRLGWTTTRLTGNGARALGPITSGPEIALTQPLLRGFGPTATLYGTRIARTDVQISEWVFRQQVIDVVTQLVYVYNELHFAAEALRVARSSRELARQLYKDNQQRSDIGVMSPLDITTARAQVAAREEDVILAERSMLDNELLLKQLVTSDLEPMLGVKVEIEPPPAGDTDVDVHAGIAEATVLRPDYRQAMIDLQQRNITIAFQKNQALPRLDLTASLGLLGLDTAYLNSISRVGKADTLSYGAGAVFSIPLGNHAARANVTAARLEAGRSLLSLQRLEQQIVVDVDIAAGQVVSDRARINATREALRLARESLDAGQQRLRAGTGTTFEVLQLQKELADAESALLRAQADHNKAVSEFYRKTGTSLKQYRVEVK